MREMPMSQLALFDDLPAPNVYVPKQEHVINRLRSICATLCEAKSWPWDPLIVRLYRERTLPYLYALVTDPAELAEWRTKIDAELNRLNAVAPVEASR
jgi:hypothetical protein